MSYELEVDVIALAREMDLLTTPYVFNVDEARAMTEAGADIVVAHMGCTSGGTIGAKTVKPLDACVERDPGDRRRGARALRTDVLCLCHGGPIAMPDGRALLFERVRGPRRLLRRELDRALPDRGRDPEADRGVHSAAPAARRKR